MGKRYDQLDLDDRIEISRLHAAGKSRREIGHLMGRDASTISRELRRNSLPRGRIQACLGGPDRALAAPARWRRTRARRIRPNPRRCLRASRPWCPVPIWSFSRGRPGPAGRSGGTRSTRRPRAPRPRPKRSPASRSAIWKGRRRELAGEGCEIPRTPPAIDRWPSHGFVTAELWKTNSAMPFGAVVFG